MQTPSPRAHFYAREGSCFHTQLLFGLLLCACVYNGYMLVQNHAHVLAFDLYYFSKKIGSTFSFFNSSALICSLILVSIEEIDQTFETAFSHIRKRVESRQKYTVTRHVVDCYHDCFAFLAVSLHFFFLRVFCFLLQSFRMLTLSSFLALVY